MQPTRPLGPIPSLPPEKLETVVLSLTNDSQFVALLRVNHAGADGHALALVADISARLRVACAHLDDDAYAALVLSLARTRVRFQLLDYESGREIEPASESATEQPQNGDAEPRRAG
jgi:hypothetical protein